jgi:hypothetical protein
MWCIYCKRAVVKIEIYIGTQIHAHNIFDNTHFRMDICLLSVLFRPFFLSKNYLISLLQIYNKHMSGGEKNTRKFIKKTCCNKKNSNVSSNTCVVLFRHTRSFLFLYEL